MIEFLSALWAGHEGYGEFRLIRDGATEQRWRRLPLRDDTDVATVLAGYDEEGWDVYFGVLPRTSREGKETTTVDTTSVLWADFDAKVYPGGAKAQAFYALGKVTPAPQIIVDSGHGYHAYWLLGGPVPFHWAARIMKGIAMATGADRTYDRPRILRVPGTHNHKDEEPTLVRVLRFDTLAPRYASEDFSDYTFRVDREEESNEIRRERKQEARAQYGTDSRQGWDDLPGWLKALITSGHDTAPDGQVIHDRSILCFKVCARLIEAGWSDEEIEDVFLSYPEGIGEKMAEKGVRGKRWLATTLSAAHRSTGI